MKIGIYPAAFDPVHRGHLAFAAAAQAQFGLDKVYFLPEPRPRHRQGVKSLNHRTNMIHLALADTPKFSVISLTTQEFDVRYIWPAITARFSGEELFMLLGNNVIGRLAAWPHSTEFSDTAPTFIIAQRSGKPTESAVSELIQTKKLNLPHQMIISNYETHNTAYIRSQLKAGKRPKAVPYAVFEYILRHKLFSAD